MSIITFLGTASAVPNKDQQNSHLIVETGSHTIMVDCVGNPVVRLEQAGIDPLSITDLILTHFHPDHVSGTPLLLMDLWLLERVQPLSVHGLADVIDRTEAMMDLFEWQKWKGFYPVHFSKLPERDYSLLMEADDIKIWASPVCHMIPNIGIRMVLQEGIVCYSSDTGPCDDVVHLARDADILIHEATGEGLGHSSPEQAGEIAQQAGVRKLYLIHYPKGIDPYDYVQRAKINFSGEVYLTRDLMKINLV